MKLLISIFITLVLSSCGTLVTRTKGDHIGAYPLTGVVVDGAVIAGGFKDQGQIILIPIGLISLPFDLVVDVILLPIDLVTWPFGLEKESLLPDIDG